MPNFKRFKKGDTFRLQLNYKLKIDNYSELIYCIFKSCKYLGESVHPSELVVDQIIEVEDYINDRDYQTIERKFENLANIKHTLFSNMYD